MGPETLKQLSKLKVHKGKRIIGGVRKSEVIFNRRGVATHVKSRRGEGKVNLERWRETTAI